MPSAKDEISNPSNIIHNMSEQGQNQYFPDFESSYHYCHPGFPINHPMHHDSSSFHLPPHIPNYHPHNPPPSENPKREVPTTQNNSRPFETVNTTQKEGHKVTDGDIVFNSAIVQRKKEVFRGTKDDTVKLNVHFKTILCNFLKQLIYANQLTPQEIASYQQFSRRVPSFKSFKHFLCPQDHPQDNSRLRQLCLDFVQSGGFIRRILSSRCGVLVKRQMVKFVGRLCANLRQNEIVRWKQEVQYWQIFP